MKFAVCAIVIGLVLLDSGIDALRGNENAKDDSKECGENQKYTTCAVRCQPTCKNPNAIHGTCTRECLIGCICKTGYLKDDNGKCVKPEECDDQPTSSSGS